MTHEFKFVEDNGRITYLFARTRSDAIKRFCEDKGCPKDYVKKHCLITCEGCVTWGK